MLLPPMSFSVPPTRFALKARPYFLSLLGLQGLLMVARFAILDLWGSLLMFLVMIMGMFSVCTGCGIDATYSLYYGLMCLVNGTFDVILFAERLAHTKYPLFTKVAPLEYNVASAIFLLCPVVEIVSAALAGYIYEEAQEMEARLFLPNYASAAADVARATSLPSRRRTQNDLGFAPFQGRSHHL